MRASIKALSRRRAEQRHLAAHAAMSFTGLFIFIGFSSGWQHRVSS